MSFLLPVALTLGATLSGCPVTSGPRDGGPIGPGIDAPLPPGTDAPITPSGPLRIEPLNQVVTLSGAPISIDYHAYYRPAGGAETEVTSECAWSSTVTALGAFAGSTFTSNLLGGLTNIRCVRGGDVAATTLTLTGDSVILLPGVPADVPDRFGGTVDPTGSPEIVYPADGVMVPPNLGELEFHFRPGASQYFELAFVSATSRVRIFMGTPGSPCPEAVGGGCAYVPDPAVWNAVSTALRGLGALTYTLRGVDAANVVRVSAPRTIRVANDNITGGLYYWNAAGSIDRFEFGVRGARRENFLDVTRTMGAVCVGCHSLSRDGSRIAVGTGPIPTNTLEVFDVATRTRRFAITGGSPSYFSFDSASPPTQIVTSGTTGLSIRDVNTGTAISTRIGGGAATMPDWAPEPEADRIVFVSYTAPPIPIETPFITGGRIEIATLGGGLWTLGAAPLVTGGGNNYYPAFSPDGEWVLFSRSPSNMANGGDDSAAPGDAQLWVIRADGSSPEVRLDTADFPGDSWGKWDPTEYLDSGTSIFWVSWSSVRGFGLRWPDGGGQSQLWMAAFDESRALAGEDPVLAAFRMPFQDAATGNHIAQWVTSIERLGCSDDTDCGGEFCIDGRCYEEQPAPF